MNDQPSPSPSPLARQPVATLAAVVFVVALALHANTLGNSFVFDDGTLIVQNPHIIGMRSWPRLFTHGYWPEELGDKLYRPLTMLSYAAQRRFAILGGLNPLLYHLVNVLLHAGNAALLCLLVVRLFGDQRRLLALAAGLIFAAHPIMADAVAPVYGRAELLATLFSFLALWWWTRGDPARPLGRDTILAAGCFGLGLLAKESVVILPAAALLCDALLGRLSRDHAKTLAIRYGALLAVVAVYFGLRAHALGGLTTAQFYYSQASLRHLLPLPVTVGFIERLATAFSVIPRYVLLLVWPVRLSPDYSYAAVTVRSFPDLPALVGFLFAVANIGAAVWLWRRNRIVAFAVALACATFSVVSNLLVPSGVWMAERFLYLPMAGLALLLACGVELLARRGTRALAVPAVVLVLWAGRTWTRNRDWHDGERLWKSAAAAQPRSVVALHNWGEMQLALGRAEPAAETFRQALQIAPDMADSHSALSRALLQQLQFDDAAAAARAALALRPQFGMARNNLALALAAKGDYTNALPELERATRDSPDYYDAWNNLGVILFNLGRYDEAVTAYKRCLDIFPQYASARFNFGLVLLRLDQKTNATEQFRAAVQFNPGLAVARLYLAQTYAQMNDYAGAERELKTGMQIEPRNPALPAALAQLYTTTGRSNDAAQAVADVNRLDPTYWQRR